MKGRQVVSYGLIAGLSYSETLRSAPGMVLDLFLYRRAYDDQMHGIVRKRKEAELS